MHSTPQATPNRRLCSNAQFPLRWRAMICSSQAPPVPVKPPRLCCQPSSASHKCNAQTQLHIARTHACPAVCRPRPALLVLTPTRELALQVTHAAETYGKQLRRLRTVSVLGGVPYRKQLELLMRQPDIVVATPGRLLDHLERGRIDLSRLSMLVLDEADRMLDMGFIDAIRTIIAATPSSRQTLLFSATLDARIGA